MNQIPFGKLLGKKTTTKKLHNSRFCNDFLGKTTKAQAQKENIDNGVRWQGSLWNGYGKARNKTAKKANILKWGEAK